MNKESEGKTIWLEKGVIEMVENYRRKQKKIPSFSDAVNTLLKKALTVSQKGNTKTKTEKLLKGKKQYNN